MNKLSDINWDTWQAKDPATLVFVVRDGKILLINKKTGLGKGKVNGPGGKVEKGESPEDCAIRECQEELGITVSNLNPKSYYCQWTSMISKVKGKTEISPNLPGVLRWFCFSSFQNPDLFKSFPVVRRSLRPDILTF